jgi:CheY-like chemotaxis protein
MTYQKIMVIDDDDDDQEIFLTAMEKIPGEFEFISFNSAHAAWGKLSKKEMKPDVIFLDLNMPMMSGQQFLTAIKSDESLKDIPVIILSTSSNARTIDLTKQLGARDFITKPNNFKELTLILQKILGND